MERTFGGVTDVAAALGKVGEALFRGELPVRIVAWDGSTHGPADAPALVIRAPGALRSLLWHPGELGIAHAYVAGDLAVDGDLGDVLTRLRRAARREPAPSRKALARAFPRALLATARGSQATPVRGVRLPSPRRDRTAGDRRAEDRERWPAEAPSPMLDAWHLAYQTGWWAPDVPAPASRGATPTPIGTLEQAQTAMLDRVCRTLGVRPDTWLLDLGCGRGALAWYAAHEYGARVTALAPSPPQASLLRDRAARAGMADRVDVMPRGAFGRANFADAHGPYDAVVSLDLGEHVADAEYAAHARAVHRVLTPGGRALLTTVSRPAGQGPLPGSPPVESYLAPEIQPRPISETLSALERAGLEIRAVHAMREHHVRTLAAWRGRLEERWAEVVSHVGEDLARAWRLHLTGAELTYDEPRAAMYQVEAVRPA